MATKKQLKDFSKKSLISFVILSTIFWSVGPSVLAVAPQATPVIVTQSSAKIVFDQNVVKSGTTDPPGLVNFSLQNPIGTNQILSEVSPYSHSSGYDFVSGPNTGIAWFSGLNSLNLSANQSFRLSFSNITNGSGEAVSPSFVDGTVTVGPRLDSISLIYGKAGDAVNFNGVNFGTNTPEVYFDAAAASITSFATEAINGVTVPTGLGAAGAKWVMVKNKDDDTLSNRRPFYLYDSSVGVLTGTLDDVGAATAPVDGVEIQVYRDTEPWNRYQGYSQKDGKFAVVVPAGTYVVAYVTPGSGSTGVAPLKSTGNIVTANNVTNLGTISFVTKVVYGKVYAPNGTTPLYGARVNVHNQSWTVEQGALTAIDGSYKVYVTPSSTAPTYIIDVESSQYDRNVNGYLSVSTTINVSSSGPYEKDITLPTENVTGTVKTPEGSITGSNPFPDTVVPRANVHLFSSDWSVDRWTQTDSNGNFKFGGVADGTYTLELEPPFCGDSDANVAKFCVYARTRIQNQIVSGGSGNFGTVRFTAPNFFGHVYVDANSNDQYDFTDANSNGRCDPGETTEGLANVWIQVDKEGFWSGSSTDLCGRYSFSVPASGNYHLNAFPPSGSAYASLLSNITITLPQTVPHNVKLSTPNVSGFVYGPTGNTGQGGWASMEPATGPGQYYGGQVDNTTGAFNINVSVNGSYNLRIEPQWNNIYVAPVPYTVVISGGVITSATKAGVEDATNDASCTLSAEPWCNGKIIVRLVDPATDPNGFTGTVYGPTGTAAESTGQQNIGIGLRAAVAEGTSCRGDGMSRWTQTNNQGKYSFSSVADGLYEIEAVPWGAALCSPGNVSCSRVRTCHTVGSTTRTKNINLSQPNVTGTIATPAGSVSDENPTPDVAVANTWVSLFTEGPMGPGGGSYGGNANESGVFALGGVPAGTYTLEIYPQWGSVYSSKRYSGITLSDSNSDGIADTTNLNTLIGTASTNFPGKAIRLGTPNVKGQVVDNLGQAVRGVWVMVHNQNWTQNAGGNTDDNGYFRIGGLSDGTGYQIEINLPWGGSQALVAPSGLSADITNNVGVIKQGGVALTNNKITLTPPTKTITGWVKKSGTTAVANAKVEAHRDMGGGYFETKTGTDGTYTLKVSGGSWWVETRPSWEGTELDWVYTEPPTRVTFAEDNSTESQSLNFSVTPTDAIIIGTVKTPTNTAVQYAWVDVKGNKGMGNGTNTDNNGRFSIKVPAGTYYVNVFSSLADYGSPDPKSITVASGGTADAGTLYLKSKNSHIKGFVQDDAGNPVQNVIVNAWIFDAPGWAMTYTDQTGAYDLSVWSGTWGVMVMPMSQNYVYMGSPKKITIASNETSNANNFQLKLANKTLKVSVKTSLTATTNVTDIWGGVWVRDTSLGMLDFGGPMEDMMQKAGMMAGGGGTGGAGTGGGPMGPGMEKGGFAGGGLMNGYTEIKVPAGTYEVGLGVPPGSRYTLDSTQTVTVAATDTSKNVTLVVKENNATISGYFYLDANSNNTYDSGEQVTGIRAFIHADREGGGWQFTESNSTTGSYSLRVAGGDWYIDAFIDPMMVFGANNQYMVINDDVKTTVADAGTVARNFKVKKLDATITGTVKNPDGTAMTGTAYGLVWVSVDFGSAEMITEFKGPGGPGLGTFTNADGTYSLKVPAGTYKIGAGIPPWDTRDLLNPDPVTVTVASNQTSTGNDLTFQASNATISGTVYLDANSNGTVDAGEAKAGFIRAWSDSGRGTGTVSLDGSYSLKAVQGDTWHVVGAAEVSDTYYESAELTVTTLTGTSSYTGKNLALVSKNISVPDGVSATFDATQSKTIKLTKSDGTDLVVLEIPAGSIATSGNITVSIIPTFNVKPDSKDKPIGLAYDFEARDSDRVEIEEFVQNVTIYMYYDPDLIAAAGYSEESITPKYYDTRTGSWENYSNVVRDTENHRFIIKTDHFSAGGPTGGGDIPSAPSSLTATVLSSSSISLSWTDNSNNETGFKVYRDGTLITTAAANATSYTDSGLSASTLYSYYVKATNASGDSTVSNTASATTARSGGVILPGGGGGAAPEVKAEVPLEKPISQMTIPELQAKIAEIQALINQLLAQLAQLTEIISEIPADYTFKVKVKYGQKSDDVRYLQIFLKAQGSEIYPEGLVTGYFGPLTRAAVIRFQEKYAADILAPWGLMQGTGVVAEKTLLKINQMLGR